MPLFVLWDGIVSSLRTYSLKEMQELVKQLRNSDQYINEYGTIIRIVEKEEGIYWQNQGGGLIALSKEDDHLYSVNYDPSLKLRFDESGMQLFQANGKFTPYQRSIAYEPSKAELKSIRGKFFSNELDISFELSLIEDKLMIKLENDQEAESLNLLSPERWRSESYILRIERDAFGRVFDILLSFDRAKNMRFRKQNRLHFPRQLDLDQGSIQVNTIGSRKDETTDILLTRNDSIGNEIWGRRLGGSSYDKASSLIALDDGYLIVGATSSYGQGNYDVYLIKTNKEGKKQWQETYGGHFNEYGYTAEKTSTGFLIKGTKQDCDSKDFLTAECKTYLYQIEIDDKGEVIKEEVLEEIL